MIAHLKDQSSKTIREMLLRQVPNATKDMAEELLDELIERAEDHGMALAFTLSVINE